MRTTRASTSVSKEVAANAEFLPVDRVGRGIRILLWQLALSLAVALAGSFTFLSRRFSAFPFSWF